LKTFPTAARLRRGRSERGAILVQVALAILMLTALLTFVVDYGVLWLSRGQAQDAADAGALAGAIARAYDESANPPAANGKAFQSAQKTAQANAVWQGTPGVQVSFACPAGVVGNCVRADVYRDGQFGSTSLPMFFGKLLNISSQGVWATATARWVNANATECMRPFSVADKWINNPLTPGGTVGVYDRWTKVGGNVVELNPHDIYTPPDGNGPAADGSGFHLGPPYPDDRGSEQTLKAGNNPNSNTDPITPGWTLPVQLPDGAGGYEGGANNYRANIATCVGNPVTIGDYLPTETGVMNGPTSQGFADLKATDPNATWNGTTIASSCAPGCAPFSPRIVPIAVFDLDDFQHRRASGDWSVCPVGGRCVHVVNILGFFADRMSGNDIVGYLMSYPGVFVNGAPNVGGGAGFLTSIQLVR